MKTTLCNNKTVYGVDLRYLEAVYRKYLEIEFGYQKKDELPLIKIDAARLCGNYTYTPPLQYL
ncbi:MAG: hypothetical protein HUU09_01170 [Candidatus Jettenia caeni]|uniref:hypothetical protein n=1 Tax=Candidatus Jettenia sp. AMX1 TaxID=2293637 RepID=UPI001795796B|nr:hypothetical protein [Candidatus Jettenia sp. AMX1]MDL1938912.1 hypothetical protein [Candidatus Jettenia sp. AMX1]NUN22065.1 hypothetical protein [Candidatus Jettenia caeni]